MPETPSNPGRPRFTYLRIAVSVLFGVLPLAMSALWVRSYSWFDSYHIGRHRFTFLQGWMYVDEQFRLTGVSQRSWQYHLDGDSNYVLFELGQAASAFPQGSGWQLPFLLIFMVCLIPCGIPWLPWSNRFSLRALLIATTLLAVMLGLAAWMAS